MVLYSSLPDLTRIRKQEKGRARELLQLMIASSGSRNFKTGGRGPGAVEFLGLGFVLMPLHTYSMCL